MKLAMQRGALFSFILLLEIHIMTKFDEKIRITRSNQSNPLPNDLANKYILGKFQKDERGFLLENVPLDKGFPYQMKSGSEGRIFNCFHDPVFGESPGQQNELKYRVLFDVSDSNVPTSLGTGGDIYLVLARESELSCIIDHKIEGGITECEQYIEPTIIEEI